MSFVLAASALLAIVQPAAIPPPVEQASADCARPVYASDMLVCEDSELRALDQRLASMIAAAPLSATALIESDSAWFSRSRRCAFAEAHRTCLAAAYEERLAVRAGLAEASAPQAKGAVCRTGGTAREASIAPVAGTSALVLRDPASDAVVGVVFAAVAKDAAWQPFARYQRRSRGVSITTLDGANWVCRT